MNVKELQRKLVAIARAHPPSDRVPYSFEKRIMALLSRPVADHWATWARALWRGALASLAFMLLLTAISWVNTVNKNPVSSADLALDFEKTLLAAVDSDTEYYQ